MRLPDIVVGTLHRWSRHAKTDHSRTHANAKPMVQKNNSFNINAIKEGITRCYPYK